MDSSATKALIMVASVLLAMLVIGFVTFTRNRTSDWATTQDEKILTEQKDKFNKEFEAYDKDLMYGLDVISCLNKAKSINDQIVEEKYVTGDKYDVLYEVKVKVELKTGLEESIEVYHKQKGLATEEKYAADAGPNWVQLKEAEFSFIKKDTEYFKKATTFKPETKPLQTKNNKKTTTEYNLTKDKNASGEGELRALLSVTDTLSETKKNKNQAEAVKENSWSRAEFKSFTYDLKTRKFTCTRMDYSSETGRINNIVFEEL